MNEDAKAADLIALLESMRQERAKLTSLAERVQTLTLSKEDGVFTRLESKSATFEWQHPNRFYGDASQPMLSCQAFRIGSDGQNWWWHFTGSDGKTTLTVCPVNDMHTRNIAICDPFGLTHQLPARAAADLGLRLLPGNEREKVAGHWLEAWDVNVHAGGSMWGELTRWHIDGHTHRPDEVASFHPLGVTRTRFHYDAVNEKLPEGVFAVPKLEGVSPAPAEALDADYTKRFVNLRDGSDGRMSVRWGKKGPKATASSGLN